MQLHDSHGEAIDALRAACNEVAEQRAQRAWREAGPLFKEAAMAYIKAFEPNNIIRGFCVSNPRHVGRETVLDAYRYRSTKELARSLAKLQEDFAEALFLDSLNGAVRATADVMEGKRGR